MITITDEIRNAVLAEERRIRDLTRRIMKAERMGIGYPDLTPSPPGVPDNIWRRIYARHLAGDSDQEIADELNRNNAPKPYDLSKWRDFQVRSVLEFIRGINSALT